jgi:hypothetical protein
VAEKDRLNLLNPPEKTPALFEKYLPYALALDVENAWSEQFSEVLAQAGTEAQPYTPVWYSGSSWDGFHTSRFTDSLGSSFASAISSSSSAPVVFGEWRRQVLGGGGGGVAAAAGSPGITSGEAAVLYAFCFIAGRDSLRRLLEFNSYLCCKCGTIEVY